MRILMFSILLKFGYSLDNGLARTPPMGWMNWARFWCQVDCDKYKNNCINEELFTQMADAMVTQGYKEAGYISVHVDDCWSEFQRDSQGRLVANRTRFPHGMKYLADYMHNRGLLFGIYGDYGTNTCAGYPGSLHHMQTDAETWAAWGVDYLKFDGCYVDPNTMDIGYPKMSRYLNMTGRPIVYSTEWPLYQLGKIKTNYTAVAQYCNLYRNYNDVQNNWDSISQIIRWFVKNQDHFAKFHGPGHWNDPDMVVVGNPGLTADQARVQMAIWSMWSAPLLMSNDLRNISQEMKDILLNREIIAIDQDPMGKMAKMIKEDNNAMIFTKPVTPILHGRTSWAVAFLNMNEQEKVITTTLEAIGLKNPTGYYIEDLFTGVKDRKMPHGSLEYTVNATGVVVLKATLAS